MTTHVRRTLAVIAGLLGLAAIVGGGKLLVAGIAHYQAHAFIEHWEKQPAAPRSKPGMWRTMPLSARLPPPTLVRTVHT